MQIHRLDSRRQFLQRLVGAGSAGFLLTPRALLAAGDGAKLGGFNIREFGVAGDGSRLDTQPIQKAIDTCAQAGGGTVYFPAGTYLSGTLFMKNRVTLHLDAGAVLLGSKELKDYPVTVSAFRSYTDNYTDKSLLYGEKLQGVAIHGRGTIDGQGAAFKGPYKVRPYLIRFVSCQDVSVRDITLKDSPMWVQHFLACDDVLVEGVRVRSRCNANNDGIDIDCCHRVRIANCDISSGDDAIVLKSTADRPCKDVAVTNCVLSTHCNAFKLGTESNGGFENVALSNCTIYDTRLAGIALELVDGGRFDRVSVANVTMSDVGCPIFVRLGNRARPFQEGGPKPGMGSLRNVSISGVQAVGANNVGCSITGLPGFPAENVALENIRISFAGGGKHNPKHEVPEVAEKYPEYKMFGVLPAYGFYCRHVRGLRYSNVHLDLAKPDERPALVCDDVEDLELFGWRAAKPSGAQPIIHFRDVRDAFIHGCRRPDGPASFLRVEGKSTVAMEGMKRP